MSRACWHIGCVSVQYIEMVCHYMAALAMAVYVCLVTIVFVMRLGHTLLAK